MPRTTALLATAALTGFAANSLLCRGALGLRLTDAATFTAVRLAAGAVVLALLARLRDRPRAKGAGSWMSALALFAYAGGFSYAYLRIGAGVGALILFGAVQLTMIGGGLAGGERPRGREWAGLVVALAGLAVLALPGARAPDPVGAALMAAAGIAWGVYSLRGRGSRHPLAATADNFLRTVPLAIALLAGARVAGAGWHAEPRGLFLAAASGALASGVGYTFWYAALPSLTATRAAIVQLAVPVVTALGAVVILGETVTPRLLIGGTAILGGLALAVTSRHRG